MAFVVSVWTAFTALRLATTYDDYKDISGYTPSSTDNLKAVLFFILFAGLIGYAGSCTWGFINYGRQNGRAWELGWDRYLGELRDRGEWVQHQEALARFEEAKAQPIPPATDREVVLKILRRGVVMTAIYIPLSGAIAITFFIAAIDHAASDSSAAFGPYMLVAGAFGIGYVSLALWVFSMVARRRWAAMAATRLAPHAETLAERVSAAQLRIAEMGKAIGMTASEVVALVESLQQELKARTAALDVLTAEARVALERADSARARAKIDEDSAKAVDAMLAAREAEHEAANHRWDTKVLLVGLVLGIPPGVVAAIIATKLGS